MHGTQREYTQPLADPHRRWGTTRECSCLLTLHLRSCLVLGRESNNHSVVVAAVCAGAVDVDIDSPASAFGSRSRVQAWCLQINPPLDAAMAISSTNWEIAAHVGGLSLCSLEHRCE
jgi:hypothetical protein